MRLFTADCGATNTSWAIYSELGEVIDSGTISGVNFFEEREVGITKLLLQVSKLKLEAIDYFGFSIAGTGNQVYRKRALGQIKREEHLLTKSKGIYLFHDGEAALWSTFKGNPGVAIISGTGAIACGKDREGNFFRCGGWGIWAGDEGSAYWIAHEAVIAVFHAYDGRYQSTILTDLILNRYRLSAVPELISLIPTIEKREIASVAIDVDKAAELGDILAIDILQRAGKNLSDQAIAVINNIGYSNDIKISCHGAVLQRSVFVKKSFLKYLRQVFKDIEIIESNTRNEKGTFLLVLNSIKKGISPDIF